MTTGWKVALGLTGLIFTAGGILFAVQYSKRGIVTVQTGKSTRQDLTSIVTASGEIKPRNYINIGTNAASPSRIVEILVTEGQQVRKGQVLARLESVQPEAEVAAQQAGVRAAEAESSAAEASLRAADENLKTLEAGIARAKAEAEQAKVNYERVARLWNEKLIAKQEYDQRRLAVEAVEAGVREAEARLLQAKAQRAQLQAGLSASQRRVAVNQATLQRAQDLLQRTYSVSPIDGMVTNLPVRVGETVVPGIQNSSASLIMTIADMSLITAEVKVDETDIVNVKLGQTAEITIDAMGSAKTFGGEVIEIGNTAILRSTGLAASQSTIASQEAKDFKVVIALKDPPPEIRPGLSATARIVTATRKDAVAIPIQALTVRQKGDLEAAPEGAPKGGETKASAASKEEIQGVFIITGETAQFRKVETGITGSTDIEVLSGIKEGEEIVTGSYKVIRTLKNGAKIKVDNQSAAKAETKS